MASPVASAAAAAPADAFSAFFDVAPPFSASSDACFADVFAAFFALLVFGVLSGFAVLLLLRRLAVLGIALVALLALLLLLLTLLLLQQFFDNGAIVHRIRHLGLKVQRGVIGLERSLVFTQLGQGVAAIVMHIRRRLA